MVHAKILPALALALVAVSLNACSSFAPVYGSAGGGITSARFNFASPDSRLEQIILDRLKVAFPGQASPSDPTLDIIVTTSTPPGPVSNAFAIARPVNVRVEAKVTIEQNGQVLLETTRFTDTAYQSGKLTPVELTSQTGAQETAAASTAESLRAAILAGYMP